MSAVIEKPVSITGGTTSQQRLADLSAVRWVWEPFKDLSFMGPTGVVIKNSIQPEEPDRHGNVFIGLRRCQPYPLTNHEYFVPPHEQIGNDLPPSYGSIAPGVALPLEVIKAPKYAHECAEELYFKYGAEYGLTVLESLRGVADSQIVELVFKIVQPFAYKLHNLEYQLTEGVAERLKVGVPEDIRQMIEQCRLQMITGTQRALKTAREQYGDYFKDTQRYVGTGKGRSAPEAHDTFIADQLGVELPTVIKQTPQAGESPKVVELLEKLTESAVEKNADKDQMAARLAQLEAEREQERAEREALMARLDALVAAKEQDAKVPTKAARN